ncbi:MerR family transcriptional regulator [Streptomyces natalensis]|uniref:Transcriptional regulator n=1 Tax=Streptomyces natalensis ATCC 27448 TaxID=1240678 RepID=A0A0D7CT07_9ACTN|nr:MerR family transcriptional regulator [Streptomyces natalensis]KIZ19358.1 transcriptional regulator [Streptomyces natalensis ATCC 27448]
MDEDELLGIGAFARRVGLAPSALRFYDDCGVLRPARVDEATGYRYYGADQAGRGVRLRRLRAAGLPLVDVAVVLDGPRDAAQGVLRAHLERTRRTADEARAVVEEFLREATGDAATRWARARVDGAELAAAVRQVASAVASGAERDAFPVLGCVLLELVDGEVRLVATDRYRLAVRVLRAADFEGGAGKTLIGAEQAHGLAEWALRQMAVEVECGVPAAPMQDAASAPDAAVLRLRGAAEGEYWEASQARIQGQDQDAEAFPDYRSMLEGLEAGRYRIIVDRVGLRDAAAGRGEVMSLAMDSEDSGEPQLEVTGGERPPIRLRAVFHVKHRAMFHVKHGAVPRISFAPAVLVPALEAGVGPDVLLEISAADQAVVVRSADQGSFTTLVMPVSERACGTGHAERADD